jgi:Predicted hydrolases of the HAD superfamily
MKYKHYAIDFDGTIAEDNFPRIGKLKPHAKRVMQRIIDNGGTIAINTCRCDEKAIMAFQFLEHNRIPFTTFNENNQELIDLYGGGNPRKISADVYIDDKNIFCNDIDWLAIEKEIFGNNKE